MRIFLLILIAIAGLGACNTVEGVGQDVEQGGEAIEDAAEDAAN